MKTKWLQRLESVCLLLCLAEVLLVILSWLLSAMRLDEVHSLLSSEGIRWFLGNFSSMLASPWLVWLLLGLSALGCLQKSGVAAFRSSYRERIALRVACFFLVSYLVVLAMLTLMPHAILLSAKGELFPSAFSRNLIPLGAFGCVLFSVTYGLMAGRLSSSGSVLNALSYGISKGAPLIILYILLMQFYESLRFVFG